jgi:excisionase family DNA binding protein
MNLKEAAQSLGVSENTLRRWLRSGKVPGVKVPSSRGEEWHIGEDAVAEARKNLEAKGSLSPSPTVLPPDLENRLARIEGALTGVWLTDLASRIDKLEAENAQLRQEVIRAQHEAQVLVQRLAENSQRREEDILAEVRAIRRNQEMSWWERLWWRIRG